MANLGMVLMLFVGPRQIFEGGKFVQKGEFNGAGRAVTLLADDDFGRAFVGVVFRLVVDLVTIDEGDDVRVLFNGAGLAQVCHLRAAVGTFFDPAVKL